MLRGLIRCAVLCLSVVGFVVSGFYFVGWPLGRLQDYTWGNSFLVAGVILMWMLTCAAEDCKKPPAGDLPGWMLTVFKGLLFVIGFTFCWPWILSLVPWREPAVLGTIDDRLIASFCMLGYFCPIGRFRGRLRPTTSRENHDVEHQIDASQQVDAPTPDPQSAPISRQARRHQLVVHHRGETRTVLIVPTDSVPQAAASMLVLCIFLGWPVSILKIAHGTSFEAVFVPVTCCLIFFVCISFVSMTLWMALGKETIVLDAGYLTTHLDILGMRFGSRHQPLREITRLRLDLTPPDERKKALGKQWTRALALQRILYEVKGRTHGLGRLLSEEEARELLALLTPGLPASALLSTDSPPLDPCLRAPA